VAFASIAVNATIKIHECLEHFRVARSRHSYHCVGKGSCGSILDWPAGGLQVGVVLGGLLKYKQEAQVQ